MIKKKFTNQMDCIPSFRGELFFLSNMYPCKVGGFLCAEAMYMSQKCPERANEFIGLNGYEAKKLGKKVKIRPDWNYVKLSIMEELLNIKFQGELLQKLLTIKGEIVERNNWGDTYWGVCNGKGQNQLGKLLMKIRDENLGVSVMKNLNDTQTMDMFEKTKSMTYSGIGSRKTPVAVMKVMTEIAQLLENKGYKLYSGAAEGADSAFAWNTTNKIEFIPWNGFNGCKSGVIATSEQAMKLASTLHPAWDRLSQGAKKLMARNCHQILGEDLNNPVDFVLCWTPDGAETSTSINTGGTGQAIRLAIQNQIPVINMFNADWYIRLNQLTGINYIPEYNRNSETFKALMTG